MAIWDINSMCSTYYTAGAPASGPCSSTACWTAPAVPSPDIVPAITQLVHVPVVQFHCMLNCYCCTITWHTPWYHTAGASASGPVPLHAELLLQYHHLRYSLLSHSWCTCQWSSSTACWTAPAVPSPDIVPDITQLVHVPVVQFHCMLDNTSCTITWHSPCYHTAGACASGPVPLHAGQHQLYHHLT